MLVEGDEVCFITFVGRTAAEDDCCVGVAIKHSYYHSWLYFLDAIE